MLGRLPREPRMIEVPAKFRKWFSRYGIRDTLKCARMAISFHLWEVQDIAYRAYRRGRADERKRKAK